MTALQKNAELSRKSRGLMQRFSEPWLSAQAQQNAAWRSAEKAAHGGCPFAIRRLGSSSGCVWRQVLRHASRIDFGWVPERHRQPTKF